MKRIVLLLLVGGVLPYLAGCVGTQTFSNVARTGDTIVVAIGVATGADFLSATDVTATVVDSLGNPHQVTVRSLVRVYADPLSLAARPFYTSPVFEGQWMAVVDLIGDDGTPPAIATGNATLQLTHANSGVDIYDPALMIISGTGTPHSLVGTNGISGLDGGMLDSPPHVGIRTEGTSTETVAGATFVLQLDSTQITDVNSISVSKFSQDPFVQLIFQREELGNGLVELKVIILNPHGFDSTVHSSAHLAGKSLLKDLSFVLSWDNGSSPPLLGTDITLVSSEYIDIAGNVIPSGLSASFYGGYGYD